MQTRFYNWRLSKIALLRIACVFLLAIPLNFAWELAQSGLYAGADEWPSRWWHCFVASLGDGILVLVIYAVGAIIAGRLDWFESGYRQYPLVLATAVILALIVEWIGVNNGHWSYTARMPLIPGLDLGLVPVLQMVVLPPLIFCLAGRLARHGREDHAADHRDGDAPHHLGHGTAAPHDRQ